MNGNSQVALRFQDRAALAEQIPLVSQLRVRFRRQTSPMRRPPRKFRSSEATREVEEGHPINQNEIGSLTPRAG